jgi:hypothetical protein
LREREREELCNWIQIMLLVMVHSDGSWHNNSSKVCSIISIAKSNKSLYLDKLRKSFNLNLLILKLEYMGLYLDKLRKSFKLNL